MMSNSLAGSKPALTQIRVVDGYMAGERTVASVILATVSAASARKSRPPLNRRMNPSVLSSFHGRALALAQPRESWSGEGQ